VKVKVNMSSRLHYAKASSSRDRSGKPTAARVCADARGLATDSPAAAQRKKDHLPDYRSFSGGRGNVRVTYTTRSESDVNTGTYEPANGANEQSKFLRYDNAKTINATLFDRTNGASTGYSQRLNGSANEKYGLARSLSVVPGDVVSAEVYAKYVDTNSSNWNAALTTLMGQIASGTAGVVVDGINYASSTSTFPAVYPNLMTKTDNGAPKAYLNWLVFDRNYVFLDGGFKQISTVARETGTDVAHEYLASPKITITQPGYVYIYISNENATNVEVYFDDFRVAQAQNANVIQAGNYYLFGMQFQEYQKEGSVNNLYKFGDNEEQEAMGLGWLDHGARMSMPEIGRWFNIDASSERYYDFSPYSYAINNPLLIVDPDGNDVIPIDGGVRFTGNDAISMFKMFQSATSQFVNNEFEEGRATQRITSFDFSAKWTLNSVDKRGKGQFADKYRFTLSISMRMTAEINYFSYRTGHYSFFGANYSLSWSQNFFAYARSKQIDYDFVKVYYTPNPHVPEYSYWKDLAVGALASEKSMIIKGGNKSLVANIYQIGIGYNPFGVKSFTKAFNVNVPDFSIDPKYIWQSREEWNNEYDSQIDRLKGIYRELSDDDGSPSLPRFKKGLPKFRRWKK
jgi:RHS repeat-associated protein